MAALAGAAAGTIYTLFTRGNDIVIPSGTSVEMVLQRPLVLAGIATRRMPTNPADRRRWLLPAAATMPKPKQRILCPFGSPGCN